MTVTIISIMFIGSCLLWICLNARPRKVIEKEEEDEFDDTESFYHKKYD